MMAYLKNLTFGKLRGILDGIRGHIAKQSTEADALISSEHPAFNKYDAMVWGAGGGHDVILSAVDYLALPLNRFAPLWGAWYNSPHDSNAERPPAYIRQQQALYRQLLDTADAEQQASLMKKILTVTAEQFYNIGVHTMPVSYGVVQVNFHNVPSFMFNSWTYPNPAPSNPCQYFIDPKE